MKGLIIWPLILINEENTCCLILDFNDSGPQVWCSLQWFCFVVFFFMLLLVLHLQTDKNNFLTWLEFMSSFDLSLISRTTFVLCPCTSTSVIFNYSDSENTQERNTERCTWFSDTPFHSSNTRVVISLLYLRNALFHVHYFYNIKNSFNMIRKKINNVCVPLWKCVTWSN